MSKLLSSYREEVGLQKRSYDQRENFGSNNLFGTIANGRLPLPAQFDFIPKDGDGGTINFNGDNVSPVWMGLQSKQMQLLAYLVCSPLAAVIDRLAEADTNGRIELIDDNGDKIKNYKKNPALNRVMNLFKQPNPLQIFEEFNSEQLVNSKIFGYCPVFCFGPAGMDKSYTRWMFNLDPNLVMPVFNYDYDMMSTDPVPKGIIKEWQFTLFGKYYTIPAENVLLVKDGFLTNKTTSNYLPISKVAGLDYAISNICAAMEADNVLLKKKGPLGVFSYDPKPDMAGWTPMSNKSKINLQKDLSRYGLSWTQLQYVISKTPIKWNPMSFSVQELMTKETARQGIDNICDRFGYPAELMSGKNATYENRTSAEKFMYQTVTIPNSIRRMSVYTNFLNIGDYANLKLNYNHLPILQEDIMKSGQASAAESQGLDIDWKNGIITFDEYRISKEREPLGGEKGNETYPQWAKRNNVNLNNKPSATTPPKDTGSAK